MFEFNTVNLPDFNNFALDFFTYLEKSYMANPAIKLTTDTNTVINMVYFLIVNHKITSTNVNKITTSRH